MPDFQSSVSVPVSRCRCRFRAVYGSRIRNDGNHFTFQCSELTDNLRQVRLSVWGILLLFACNVWQTMGNCILHWNPNTPCFRALFKSILPRRIIRRLPFASISELTASQAFSLNLLFRNSLNLVLNKIGLFLIESINLLWNDFQLPEIPAMFAIDF